MLELLPLKDSLVLIRAFVVAPLALYFVAILLQTIALVPLGGIVRSLLAMHLLVLSHIFYGIGFWRGLFTKLNRGGHPAAVEVVLEKIQS